MRTKPGLRYTIKAACLLLAAGCAASADNRIDASLETDFNLRAGQTALLSEAMLEVGFIGVASDSRCGKGEVCFMEGDAVVRIWLQSGNQDIGERDLHTASNKSNVTNYDGYRIRLVALYPPRISGTVIAAEDYVAVLRIAADESAN